MPTKHDQKLIDLLTKKSGQWAKRFGAFEDEAASELRKLFNTFEREKRLRVLAFLDSLEVDANGVLMANADNIRRHAELLREMEALGAEHWGKNSSFGKWVDKQYERAAKLGIIKAKDTVAIGEGSRLTAGYSPPSKKIVTAAKKMTFRLMADRTTADLGVLRQSFYRHLYDPSSRIENLRQSLVDSGQVEGMMDSIGRRVTADERADRIAKYELAELAEKVEEQTAYDIYNGGKPDPKAIYYLWKAVGDSRTAGDSWRRDGQVLSAEEWQKHDFGDRYRGRKPLRPRDRCANILVRPDWFSKEIKDKYFNNKTTKLDLAA